MKTLIITDLARSRQLDRPTMTAVRGGWKLAPVRQAPLSVPDGAADKDVTQTRDNNNIKKIGET